MTKRKERPQPVLDCAAAELPAVTVDSYNLEVRDANGFVGDRASNRAFMEILEEIREAMRQVGDDPLGEEPTSQLKKKQIDRLLRKGGPEAAGVVLGAIEEFAQDLAAVIRRFLQEEGWSGTERIVAGGGLSGSRAGELAIGRATALLKLERQHIGIVPVRHDPDEAGLIGAAYLVPPSMLAGHDAVLAVDIGGSSIRAGVLKLPKERPPVLDNVRVWRMQNWHYADADPKPGRDEAVARLSKMLRKLIAKAEDAKFDLAPLIGIGCPGSIGADGSILQGGQNLPGDWERDGFNLPDRVRAEIPMMGKKETCVAMHNDAVVQGLSETPRMQDVSRWGVLTIGTGLGNARFTNRRRPKTWERPHP